MHPSNLFVLTVLEAVGKAMYLPMVTLSTKLILSLNQTLLILLTRLSLVLS